MNLVNRMCVLAALMLFTSLGATSLHAQQEVRTSAGVRFGSPWALSLKQFFTPEAAVEVFAGYRFYIGNPYNYTSVGGAYLHHIPLELDAELSSLHAYVGAGASVQFWNYEDSFFGFDVNRGDFNERSIRLSAYVGGQYAFEDVPVELTIDWSPSITTGSTPFSRVGLGWYTLGARYIIGRQ